MKRAVLGGFIALLLGVAVPASAVVFVWTGIGTGWKGQVTPTGSGGEDLVFGDGVKETVTLFGTFTVNNVAFTEDGNWYRFVTPGSPANFNLTGGVSAAGTYNTRADFSSDITFGITAAQTWNMGELGSATIHGKLTGTGNLTVTGINQTLLLSNLTASPSDYSGNITFATDPSAFIGSFPTLVLWGSQSIGTGSLTFNNGGYLITHAAPIVTNSITLNAGPLLAGQLNYAPFRVRSWDAKTQLAGPITLANNTIILANTGFKTKVDGQFPNNTGSRPLPGPITRYPLLITGAIVESGGARSLNITGPGIVILAGSNSYTGGTGVGFSLSPTASVATNANGSLIFANQAAIPATGAIQAGLANTTNATGYVGIATSAVSTPGDFATFLSTKVSPTSSGAVGLDSLTGNLPSSSPATFSENISLSGFTTTATGGIRLGTATSVILTGAIALDDISTYHFGNGGGKLYVQTALNSQYTTTSLQTNNSGVALMLYLQGANTYNGGTFANNGFIIFDGASAIPSTGSLVAGGTVVAPGVGYIGHTENTGLTPAAFLAKFNQAATWGVIGFDSTNIGSPVTIANLNLTGFNDGVFIGTTSAATLTGTLTPSSVTNGSNAANTLRFTAADGGKLTVASTITTGSVVIGTAVGFAKMADGTVLLNGNNSYSGGTLLNSFGSMTLAAGHNNAFGTGVITLGSQGGLIGLEAATSGLTIANNLTFAQAAPGLGMTPQLMLTGANNFTLSGNITGPLWSNAPSDANPNGTGIGSISLINPTPINVTLTGNNSGYYGGWLAGNGTLIFDGANAVGHGSIQFDSAASNVAFTTSTTLYGLYGDNGGQLNLANGMVLTVDTKNPDGDFEFNGSIGATTASLIVTTTATGGDEPLYLYGPNAYSGGTTITSDALLGLGLSSSAGTGAITLNAPQGGLILNTGVTLTNDLVFHAGGLGGIGTFAPANVSGTGQTAGKITFGVNQVVFPGLPSETIIPGKLTLASSVAFANGGTYRWTLQNATDPEGYSQLYITGNLDLASITSPAFTLSLQTIDASGNGGPISLVLGTPYTFIIAETGGSISGFNAANFIFDASDFQGGIMPNSAFSVTADANHLYLNFTAVPEPSTYALLALGLGFVGLTLWRRRSA